jgi:hypothetical protein
MQRDDNGPRLRRRELTRHIDLIAERSAKLIVTERSRNPVSPRTDTTIAMTATVVTLVLDRAFMMNESYTCRPNYDLTITNDKSHSGALSRTPQVAKLTQPIMR